MRGSGLYLHVKCFGIKNLNNHNRMIIANFCYLNGVNGYTLHENANNFRTNYTIGILIDPYKLEAFFGLFYFYGVKKSNHRVTAVPWSSSSVSDYYKCAMS